LRPVILSISLVAAVIAAALNLPELRDFDLLYLLPLGALLVPLIALFVDSRSPAMFALQSAIAALVLGLILPEGFGALKSDTALGAALLCLGNGLVLMLLLCRVEDRHSWQENWPVIVPVAYVSFVLALATPGEAAPNIGPGRAAAMFGGLWLIVPAALSRYSALIDDELALGDDVSEPRQLPRTPTSCKSLPGSLWITWLALVGSGIAIIASFVILLGRTSLIEYIQGEFAGPESFQTSAALLVASIVVAIALASAALLVLRREGRPYAGVSEQDVISSEVPLWPFSLGVAGCLIAIASPWVITAVQADLSLSSVWLVWPASFGVTLVAALGTWGCIKHNSEQIEFLHHGQRATLLILLCTLASASTTFWLFMAGMWQGAEVARLATTSAYLAIVALAQVALASLITLLVFHPGLTAPRKYLSLHSPAANVAHDHIHQGLLLLGAVTIIYFLFRISAIFSEEGPLVLAAIYGSPVFAFLLIASSFFGRIERETKAHVERERKRMSSAIVERFLARAEQMNKVRVDIIAKRFEEQLRLTRWFLVLPQVGSIIKSLDRLIFPRPELEERDKPLA
jgi:hypothetical protein